MITPLSRCNCHCSFLKYSNICLMKRLAGYHCDLSDSSLRIRKLISSSLPFSSEDARAPCYWKECNSKKKKKSSLQELMFGVNQCYLYHTSSRQKLQWFVYEKSIFYSTHVFYFPFLTLYSAHGLLYRPLDPHLSYHLTESLWVPKLLIAKFYLPKSPHKILSPAQRIPLISQPEAMPLSKELS